MSRLTCLLAVAFVASLNNQSVKAQSMPKMITSVEGIAEFELENGMRVLLFPDQTKDTVTVNNTIFVGGEMCNEYDERQRERRCKQWCWWDDTMPCFIAATIHETCCMHNNVGIIINTTIHTMWWCQ